MSRYLPLHLRQPLKGKLTTGDTDILTFEDIGFEELTMQGPFAASGYFFDFPPTWKIEPGMELRLVLDTFFTSTFSNSQSISPTYGGSLIVQYNYTTVTVIDLNQEGQREVVIPIPLDIINQLGEDQSQSIQFILDSGVNCDFDFKTTVVIRSESEMYIPHEQIPPPVNLTFYRFRFIRIFLPQISVIIVVPNQPSAGELQAALSVAAGLGQMTFNRFSISVMPVSQITPEMLANNNFIFVGKADGLPFLQDVSLPAQISGNAYVYGDMLPSDGIIQMAVSPWNAEKVIMVVGGNEDQAVINAGRALSTGELRVGNDQSVSIVSNAKPFVSEPDAQVIDQTFEDLGYDSVVVGEVGVNSVPYLFNIPQGYILGPDAYLKLGLFTFIPIRV